jgi:hypothetical protein
VIDVDVEEVLVEVAVTDVILPPDTVIDTATDPYWWVTVGPANVPFLKPLAGGAVVALAVVTGAAAVVAFAAVVAAAAVVVPALVATAVVPVLAVVVVAAAAAAPEVWTAAETDASVPAD